MVLTGQVQREIVGLINAHGPYAVGLSGEDAHVFTAERRDAIVDGEPVDIGLVGDVVAVAPDFVLGLLDDGLIPVVSSVARGRRRPGLQRQRRHRRRRAGRRARCREARGAHRRRGPVRRLAGERRGHQPAARRRARGAAADPVARHGAQDGGLPAGGRRAVSPGRTSSTAGCRTRCCSRCSPPRASGPWCSRERLRRRSRTRWAAVMMPNYGVPPVALARGAGTPSLGRRRRRIPRPVRRDRGLLPRSRAPGRRRGRDPSRSPRSRTRATSWRTSPASASPSGCCRSSDADGRVFFCQDGAEANEAALKLARRHGRAPRALGGRLGRRGRGCLPRPDARLAVHHRDPGQARAVRAPARSGHLRPLRRRRPRSEAAVDDTVAAVFLETTLGEGGVVPAPEGYLAAARAACDRTGALLVVDEVQSGIGRTGHWFASLAQGVQPDVITLAKGLAGGLPIGACIGLGQARAASSGRATTARRSAATRCPARRRSPCSTPSSPTTCSPT